MPIKILNGLIKFLTKDYYVEIFLDHNSKISNFLYDKINIEKAFVIDPKNKQDLISSIKNIQYGIFMDSGPLHVAKMFNKKG